MPLTQTELNTFSVHTAHARAGHLERRLDRIEQALHLTWLAMAAVVAVYLRSLWKQRKPAASWKDTTGSVFSDLR